MPKKPKFKSVITRIKLNPEQAVLSCMCSNGNNVSWRKAAQHQSSPSYWACMGRSWMSVCNPSGGILGINDWMAVSGATTSS